MSFWIWLISFSRMLSKFIHVVAFSFYGWIIFYLYITTFCLSIHLLREIWVVFILWLFWIVLLWACTAQLYKYPFKFPFLAVGYTPRSRIAGLCGNSMFTLLNHHAVFHILHSRQQCTGVTISPHLCQSLLFSFYHSHASGDEVLSHGFDFHFPDD